MAKVLMYTSAYCPYCTNAERFLHSKGVSDIEKIQIDTDPELKIAMMEKTGRRTVPQIYIGERHIGGFDDLRALDLTGGLGPLLSE
jgi:glutaredoxin 3